MDVSKYFGSYKKSNLNYLIKLIKQYEKAIDKYTNYAKPFLKGLKILIIWNIFKIVN